MGLSGPKMQLKERGAIVSTIGAIRASVVSVCSSCSTAAVSIAAIITIVILSCSCHKKNLTSVLSRAWFAHFSNDQVQCFIGSQLEDAEFIFVNLSLSPSIWKYEKDLDKANVCSGSGIWRISFQNQSAGQSALPQIYIFHIYTRPKFAKPTFTQNPDLHKLKFTQLRFTHTQIYIAPN